MSGRVTRKQKLNLKLKKSKLKLKKLKWKLKLKKLKLMSPSYKQMLDTFPNLQQLTIALKNMSFGSASGYDTALSVLGGSYNPGKDWPTLQALFDKQLPTTIIQQKIFLARTIHILWMEKHGQLPWTIRDYSKDEINALFYEEWVNNYSGYPSLKPKLSIPSQNMGYVYFETYADPKLELEASYKLHELALKIKANTKELSVTNAVRWIKTEFFHAYKNGVQWGWNRYNGKPNPYVTATGCFLPANLESLFDERIVGCHEPVMLLSEILRSLNIPAVNVNVGGDSHAVTYIPSFDSYVHGDHLAKRPLVPVSLILLTKDEIVQYSNQDPMLYDLLDNKIRAVFDPNLAYLLTYGIRRAGSTLTLDITYGGTIPVPPNIVETFRTEAEQYNIRYDVAAKTFTSQAVPIQSLESLSRHLWI